MKKVFKKTIACILSVLMTASLLTGAYSVRAEGNDWHTIEREDEIEYSYLLEQTGVKTGENYIIADDVNAVALHDNGSGNLTSQAVTVNGTEIRTKDRTNEWTFTKQNSTVTGPSHPVPAYNATTVNYSASGNYNTTGLFYQVGEDYLPVTGLTSSETDGMKKWVVTFDGGSSEFEDHYEYENQEFTYSGRDSASYHDGDDYVDVNGVYKRITAVSCTRSGNWWDYTYTWNLTLEDGTHYTPEYNGVTISYWTFNYNNYANGDYYYRELIDGIYVYHKITKVERESTGFLNLSANWTITTEGGVFTGTTSILGGNLTFYQKALGGETVTTLKKVFVEYPSITLYTRGTTPSTTYDYWRITSTQRANNNYITLGDNSLTLNNTSNADLTITEDGNGFYKLAKFKTGNYGVYSTNTLYFGTGWGVQSESSSTWAYSYPAPTEQVRLYRYAGPVNIPVPSIYAALVGQRDFIIPVGCTEAEALALLTKDKVSVLENSVAPTETGATQYALSENSHVRFARRENAFSALANAVNTYDVYYIDPLTSEEEFLGAVTLSAKVATAISIQYVKSGSVYVDADSDTETGALLTVSYSDGTEAEVPITVGMLRKNGAVSTAEAGTFMGLDILYNTGSGNLSLTEAFTLHVLERPESGAMVHYAYYLVNAEGQPLAGPDGTAAPNFAGRYAVTSPVLFESVEFHQTVTQMTASIVAADYLPEEYSLYNENATYSVTANADGTGSFTINDSLPVKTTFVTGYDTNHPEAYTNENSNSSANRYHDTTVWFGVTYAAAALPDSIAVDHGLPVRVHVLDNDLLNAAATLTGLYDGVHTLANNSGANNTTSTIDSGFSALISTEIGTFAVSGNDVVFTPGAMTFSAPYTVSYAVTGTKNSAPAVYYGTLTVIPATTIYFEDQELSGNTGFVTYVDDALGTTTGKWTVAGTEASGMQDEDRSGFDSLASIDANNVYGYDSAYANSSSFSQGAAHHVTVSAANNPNVAYSGEAGHNWPTAQFTFTGTGFDLISLTDNTTGLINVKIYSGTTASGKVLRSNVVDSYYGYTSTPSGYKKYTWKFGADGLWHIIDEAEISASDMAEDSTLPATPSEGDIAYSYEKKYEWTPSTDNALYQIPIIRVKDLTYGTYTALITVSYSSKFDHAESGNYGFYMDGIRIYNPTNNNAAALNHYKEDGEAYPEYLEIRNNLLDARELSLIDDTNLGAVFIDGLSDAEDNLDFEKSGPNNEVYLNPGQGIAFQLNSDNAANIAGTQMGIKALRPGTRVDCTVAMQGGASKNFSINSVTEMYYDISSVAAFTNGETDVMVVMNTGNAVLSLTNVKITYKIQQPMLLGVRMTSSRPMLSAARNIMTATTLGNMPKEAPQVTVPEEKAAEETEAVVLSESETDEAEKGKAEDLRKESAENTEKETLESGETVTESETYEDDTDEEISMEYGIVSEEEDTRSIFEIIWDAIVAFFRTIAEWFKSLFK